jgi:hypothetical protein
VQDPVETTETEGILTTFGTPATAGTLTTAGRQQQQGGNNSREAKSSKDANNSMDRQKHWKHYQMYQVRTSTAVGMAVTAESLATAGTQQQ